MSSSDDKGSVVIRNRARRDGEGDTTEQASGTVADVSTASTGTNSSAGPPQPPPQGGVAWKDMLLRLGFMWLIINLFRSRSSTEQPTSLYRNLFQTGEPMNLWMYLTEEAAPSTLHRQWLFWNQTDIKFGLWTDGPLGDGSRVFSAVIPASERLQKNGSLYLHACITTSNGYPEKLDDAYSDVKVTCKTKLLTVFKKRKVHKTKNLLTGEADLAAGAIKAKTSTQEGEIIAYWHPNLTVNILDDQTPMSPGGLPQPLLPYYTFINRSGDLVYSPVIYFNDFWNFAHDYQPISELNKTLELTVTYSPISMVRWQLYASQSSQNKWSSWMSESEEDKDEQQDVLKRTLSETSPYLLALTLVVSLVHSVFEFLAFKNDIQFWRSRQSLEGLSVRSVVFGVFQSVIVFLYILDNDTNVMVIISCFVGLLIDAWKITKVIDITVDWGRRLGPLPRLQFKDKSSYSESPTKHYDRLAFKYLSWALFPLLAGYAVYSLVYLEHKGWYSWVLGMIYGFLLTFGFIMMTPQLFINYKMKSVAHLPWRMLTYKALNTFIDDIFAFIIRMPTLYRLGCLRDDIIFFIYLYQRWIYPTDYRRLNEFGTTGEDHINGSPGTRAETLTTSDNVNTGREALPSSLVNAKKTQ